MLRNLVRLAFPTRLTFVYVIIFLLLFLFNDRIGTVLILLNGGVDVLCANGNQLTFVSSLISWLPLLELVVLTILLWKSGKYLKQEAKRIHPITPVEGLAGVVK